MSPSPSPSPARGEGDNKVGFNGFSGTKMQAANEREIQILNLDIAWVLP
jgi:hypothetical protein